MRYIVMLLTLTVTLSTYGDGADFRELISGKTYPLTLKMKDLNKDWRRMGVGDHFYYTKGQTETVGSETVIIAYRVQWERSGSNTQKPDFPKLTPETVLALSLLNLRNVGSLNDIRLFDLKQEIEEHERMLKGITRGDSEEAQAMAADVISVHNLTTLGSALRSYLGYYDNTFPVMKDAATVKKTLLPFVSGGYGFASAPGKKEDVFVHPATKEPYQPNPTLSGKKLADIADSMEMVVFYEARPVADGTRGVLLLASGFPLAKRVSEVEWAQLKKASKIP